MYLPQQLSPMDCLLAVYYYILLTLEFWVTLGQSLINHNILIHKVEQRLKKALYITSAYLNHTTIERVSAELCVDLFRS
jgi:hypothetical protein